MVGAELQDQLSSPIGVQAEAHDVAEPAPGGSRRGAWSSTSPPRRGSGWRCPGWTRCTARPLRRLVQSAIGYQLARRLLAGEIRDGDTTCVDLDAAAAG
jgi:hypothetical protein